MTRDIRERVLNTLLEHGPMSMKEIQEHFDHDSEAAYVVEHYVPLGYIRRDKDTDTYSLRKAGRICIESINQASKVSR